MTEDTMDMMQGIILGNRRELDKYMAFAAKHASTFSVIKGYTHYGRTFVRTNDPSKVSYEVGTVDNNQLMRAYVEHVLQEKRGAVVQIRTEEVGNG